MAARTHTVEEERELAGTLAGVLFVVAAASSVALPLVPGVEDAHFEWVVTIAVVLAAWGIYCLTLARPEEHGAWFWHAPAIGALALISADVAATGGAHSPARFYLFFLVVYASYFYQRHDALPYVLGSIAAALLPLVYDTSAVEHGYVGELIVLCPGYLAIGLLVIKGKELLVGLRDRAEALACLDPLTDLPNRRAMMDWLRRELERESPTGLILVDLDGFKDVNTAHGYPAGDALLRETAARLRHAVRTDDVVARLGGDEFAVLAPRATRATMGELCERLLYALRELEYEDVQVTASVGWVMYPDMAASVDELIAAADFCLRGAKLTGKDRVVSVLDWSA